VEFIGYLTGLSSAGLGQGSLLVPLADGWNFVYVVKWRRYRRKKGGPRVFETVVVC
jgi:hypothetical protein